MKKRAGLWVAAAAVLAVQAAGLWWLATRGGRVVANGTEVRIPCVVADWKDLQDGACLQVRAALPCGEFSDLEKRRTNRWPYGLEDGPRFHALLEPAGEGEASHRVARVALEPEGEGLWVKVPKCRERWNPGENRSEGAMVEFPGKLFLDERLAGAADEAFRQRGEKKAVAVYRAKKGQIVIADVELDGVSVREWARRIRTGAAE